MKMRRVVILGTMFSLFAVLSAKAQVSMVSNLQNSPEGGTVYVHQDYRITEAMSNLKSIKTEIEVEDDNSLGRGSKAPDDVTDRKKLLGYRIQIYAGNNSRQARDEANAAAARVKKSFPELAVYTHFQSPRWVCRVGNFRTMEEAQAAYRRLYREPGYREYSIVKSPIVVSKTGME